MICVVLSHIFPNSRFPSRKKFIQVVHKRYRMFCFTYFIDTLHASLQVPPTFTHQLINSYINVFFFFKLTNYYYYNNSIFR